MDQTGGFVFGQIVEAGFDDVGLVVTDGERDTLGFFVDRPLNGLIRVLCGIREVTVFVSRDFRTEIPSSIAIVDPTRRIESMAMQSLGRTTC